jgi:hypothetical protein
VQRQRGFTRDLGLHEMRAFVHRPYSKEICLDQYGTVLLFASGIRIASQLPYMRQLLDGFRRLRREGKEDCVVLAG